MAMSEKQMKNTVPNFIFQLQHNFPHWGAQRPWQKTGHDGSTLFKQNCTLISTESSSKTQTRYSPRGPISENAHALQPRLPFLLLFFLDSNGRRKFQSWSTLPLCEAQDKLGPTKITRQDWDLSVARTSCQPLYKGMRLPQNNFPQMDNPC